MSRMVELKDEVSRERLHQDIPNLQAVTDLNSQRPEDDLLSPSEFGLSGLLRGSPSTRPEARAE